MKILYRCSNGTALGDIVMTRIDTHATTPAAAVMRAWAGARTFNRSRAKAARPITTIQCGDLLLDVTTGKLRSLTGPTPAPLVAQPALPLADKTQPSLFEG